uniref:Retinoic acid receptor responder protein 2 n=1 Tax=Cyclopterus lumpus TaxID=8103 RepID=A0A8C2ZJE2_CYCLU
MKMAAGLLLLVCAGAVLYSAQAQDSYRGLPDDYKKGVDLALEQLNAHPGVLHHFRFLRSLAKSDIESGFGVKYFYHHFYLKPTKCAKGTTASDPQTCPFRNDRPLIDCAICYKTAADQIESTPMPYVHCMQKPRLTEEMRTTRTEHCKKMNYNSGAPTLLAVSTGTK